MAWGAVHAIEFAAIAYVSACKRDNGKVLRNVVGHGPHLRNREHECEAWHVGWARFHGGHCQTRIVLCLNGRARDGDDGVYALAFFAMTAGASLEKNGFSVW
jgi:hypothetical protein